jgi:peroxin-13
VRRRTCEHVFAIAAKAMGDKWRRDECLDWSVFAIRDVGRQHANMANNSAGLAGSGSSTASTATSSPPPLPSVPDSLSTVANRNATNYSGMNNRMSPYGGAYGGGGYNSYSSPYSSFGGGYGSMYGGMGGMGGMGSMYGGMGMGMGGMYGGMGMPGDPNNPASLTQSFSQSTAATFQLIENIVGAFGGFAQMLQSTYMATHSSFFGMSVTSHLNLSANIQ